MNPDAIQKLRGLLDAAASLPWAADGHGREQVIVSASDGPIADRIWPQDVALIVAAVNALPALLDVAEAALTVDTYRLATLNGWAALRDALERLGET